MTTKQEAAEASAKEALVLAVKRYEEMASGARTALRRWEENPEPNTLTKILEEIAASQRLLTEKNESKIGAFLDGMDTAADVACYAYAFTLANHKEEEEQ